MGRRKGMLILLFLFGCSVLLRLPNINRPLSKHHEYNTAVILINIESWRQSGGGAVYHYVPLLNFQHPGDRIYRDMPQTDSSGNILYMSFGPGWYIIPYFIYQVFNLPSEPVYLQVINLAFNLAAIVLLFLLCEQLIPAGEEKKYEIVLMTCTLFLFSPAVLWYLGNGYVTTGIEMPFIIALLLVLMPMLQSSKEIKGGRLVLLSLLIILLVYIDWLAVFISMVVFCRLLFKRGKDVRGYLLLAVIAGANIAALALMFLQFVSYTSTTKLLAYLQHQFLFRSITSTSGQSFFSLAGSVIMNIATSYLPLIALLAAVWSSLIWRKMKMPFVRREVMLLGIYGVAVAVYNLTLLQWSAEHEFALIPLGLLLALPAARLLARVASVRIGYMAMAGVLVVSCLQYYFINKPGEYTWSGQRYDSYERLGQQLRGIPGDSKIFMQQRDWSAVIDYYANRTVVPVKNIDSARHFMQELGARKAVWIEQKDLHLQKIVPLR